MPHILTQLFGCHMNTVFSEAQPGGNRIRLEFSGENISFARRLTSAEARELAAALIKHADAISPDLSSTTPGEPSQ